MCDCDDSGNGWDTLVVFVVIPLIVMGAVGGLVQLAMLQGFVLEDWPLIGSLSILALSVGAVGLVLVLIGLYGRLVDWHRSLGKPSGEQEDET